LVQAVLGLISRVQRLQAAKTKLAKTRRRSTKKVAVVEQTSAFDVSKYSDDFVGFAALLDILPKDSSKGRIKLRPTAIQAAFEARRTGRDIVLKPRQIGFTTWELARDVFRFVVHRERVAIVCQSSKDDDQVKDLSAKLTIMFESLEALGLKLPFASESVSEWRLGDASLRIIGAGASSAAAQKKGRGVTLDRLHITELAFFEHAQVTLNALFEAVHANGEVTIESTANGAAGVFFERYQAAKAGHGSYAPHFFAWIEHAEYATPLNDNETIEPRTPREKQLVEDHGGTLEQLKWYRAKVEDKGQDLVDQEYPIDEASCWLIAGRMFFDREACVELKAKTTDPLAVEWRGELWIWEQPKPSREYLVIGDPSEGTGGDPGGAIVLDRFSGDHVATLHGQFPPGLFADKLAALGWMFNTALVVVERNNHGHAVLLALSRPTEAAPGVPARKAYPRIYRGRDNKPGWHSNEITRSAALDGLENAVRKGQWRTRDARAVAEMFTFVVKENGKAEHANGAHDELVIVMAVGHDVISKPIASGGGKAPAPEVGESILDRAIGIE
jgi:hypothetical protein